jgi:putative ABC transport system permease protein
MFQDLRFGFRMLIQSPGFTALALVMLALGIGANTTIFSIINSVLLRPLPFERPEQIVQVQDLLPGPRVFITSSLPKFNFLHQQVRSFQSFTAISPGRFQISGPRQAAPAEIIGARVSPDFFAVFGAKPALGRVFLEEEGKPGAPYVAVITDALWQNRFAADPGAIGKTVNVDGAATTIVGVLPPAFVYNDVQIFTPRFFEHPVVTQAQIQRGGSYLIYCARLRDGVESVGAEAELATLSAQYDSSHAGYGDVGRPMRILPLKDSIVSDVRKTLLVLFGAVAFVLLIASANVANLLLARALSRHKEVAIRASLGASRGRLLAQFLIESVLLAGMGAVLGLVLAFESTRLVTKFGGTLLPRAAEIQLDARVLFFTVAVAVLTGILFGIGPAIHASRTDLNDALKAASRTLTGGGKLRGAMVAAEVALAVVLLTGAGLLMRSFLLLENVSPGFQTDNLLTMRIGLASARYAGNAQRSVFYDRVLERVSSVPSVQSAAITNAMAPNGRAIGYFFNIEGRPALEPAKAPTAWLQSVSPGYFQTLGIPLLGGRTFTDADTADAPAVVIVNQTMARRFWPGEDPIGKHVIYARESIVAQVVGIAGEIKAGGLADDTAYNQIYVPYRQRPFLSVILVTRGPSSAASAIAHEIVAIDPEQPVNDFRTMNEVLSESVSQPRLRTWLIGSFAALALLLAMIGIGGVVASSVSQRTSEIGIRVALGARPSNVIGLILAQAFAMIGAGQLLGLAGALALTRVLSTFLFGTSPEDPLTFGLVLVALTGAALGASMLAARRALRIDPATALRAE